MRFRAPDRVGHVFQHGPGGPEVYLCPLPDGPPTALTGSAAVIWMTAASGEDDLATVVAEIFGVEVETIRQDVEDYLGYLVGAGLLERAS